MIIIGEKLNSSIPKTLNAINERDEEYLVNLIKKQQECGAEYLDINTAICGDAELSNMLWLIDLAMEHSSCGIMVDSPSVEIIKSGVAHIKNRKIIINSITLCQRIDELLQTIKEYNTGVVCLPIGDSIPTTVEGKVENARLLIERLTAYGISPEKIYIDVLVEALSVDSENAISAIETIKQIKYKFPKIKTTCGLSNISFGLPQRININTSFLAIAVFSGLCSAIMDITSPATKTMLSTTLAISGQDEYCIDYINEIRNG